MTFPIEIEINLSNSQIPGITNKQIIIHDGLTTFLGPNGSGKTQLLRGLKPSLNPYMEGRIIRYLSAGRLGPMENYRSDFDGQRRGSILFDSAKYGDKQSISLRHKNETIIGDFATLSDRPDILVKIQERLSKLFHRNLSIDWDGGYLKVYFSRVDEESGSYSSAREASGLLHLVSILAALYDNEVGCLLIDEPEVSLHPQLQSFLLNEIKKVAGSPIEEGKKLIFISTHSTEFVELNSVDQLATIIFCKDILQKPIQIDPTQGEFRGKKLQALLSRIGQEHKLSLFCHYPLLVEGPSDQILCSAISTQLDLNLEAAGSQILPITGKGQFPIVVKLLRLIGKRPAILADADAFTDGLEIITSYTSIDEAENVASKLGHRDAIKFSNDVYNDFCQKVITNWDDIKDKAEKESYWINRDKNKDESIAKRRSAFTFLFNNSNDQLEKLDNSKEWSLLKNRISTLLEILENLGCFILRKGTIEAYYVHADKLTNEEKPNAASLEASNIISNSEDEINKNYKDIIRALRFCSNIKEINEAESIRATLLSIVSPALASINEKTTSVELKVAAQNVSREKSKLFNLNIERIDNDIYLVIDLASKILEVQGFPLKIKKGDDVIKVVNKNLKLE